MKLRYGLGVLLLFVAVRALGVVPMSTLAGALVDFQLTVPRSTMYFGMQVYLRANGTFQELSAYAYDCFSSDFAAPPEHGTYRYEIESTGAKLTLVYPARSLEIPMTFESDKSGKALDGWGTFRVYSHRDTTDMPNISTRAWITPAHPAILGFISSRGGWYLLRLAGPALTKFGVKSAIQKPKLILHPCGVGKTATSYGRWSENSVDIIALQTMAKAVGAYPFENDSNDVAVLVNLEPGGYTLESTSETETGETLCEVYALPFEP